jgi:hypothetical protein
MRFPPVARLFLRPRLDVHARQEVAKLPRRRGAPRGVFFEAPGTGISETSDGLSGVVCA